MVQLNTTTVLLKLYNRNYKKKQSKVKKTIRLSENQLMLTSYILRANTKQRWKTQYAMEWEKNLSALYFPPYHYTKCNIYGALRESCVHNVCTCLCLPANLPFAIRKCRFVILLIWILHFMITIGKRFYFVKQIKMRVMCENFILS